MTPDGTIYTVAGNGTQGFSGDGGPATAAPLNWPTGVAVDGSGNLYIADYGNGRIRKVTPDGIMRSVAGGANLPLGDGGPATAAELYWPMGVAVDGGGDLFIADTWNSRIRKVTPDGTIRTVAGDSPIGEGGFSGDGGPATAAWLSLPSGVAVDGSGNLYIADTDNRRVRKVTPDGTILTVAGNGRPGFNGDGVTATAASLSGPGGVAVAANGNVYIADGNRIRKLAPRRQGQRP